jgi:hypothetical protein
MSREALELRNAQIYASILERDASEIEEQIDATLLMDIYDRGDRDLAYIRKAVAEQPVSRNRFVAIYGEDSEQVNYWIAQLVSGMTYKAVIYAIMVPVFQDILGQSIRQETMKYYTSMLSTGTFTLAYVRTKVAQGAEARSRLESIYQDVLGRGIDPTGYNSYSDALAKGWNLTRVRNAVAYSAEAYTKLAMIFQDVVGHAATTQSEKALLGQLQERLAEGSDISGVYRNIVRSNFFINSLDALLQEVAGRSYDPQVDNHTYTGYQGWMLNGFIETYQELRERVATSWEVKTQLMNMYAEVWGQLIDPEDLNDYTALLSLDWTLAEVRADMEEVYFQTVVVPVLIITTLLQ